MKKKNIYIGAGLVITLGLTVGLISKTDMLQGSFQRTLNQPNTAQKIDVNVKIIDFAILAKEQKLLAEKASLLTKEASENAVRSARKNDMKSAKTFIKQAKESSDEASVAATEANQISYDANITSKKKYDEWQTALGEKDKYWNLQINRAEEITFYDDLIETNTKKLQDKTYELTLLKACTNNCPSNKSDQIVELENAIKTLNNDLEYEKDYLVQRKEDHANTFQQYLDAEKTAEEIEKAYKASKSDADSVQTLVNQASEYANNARNWYTQSLKIINQ